MDRELAKQVKEVIELFSKPFGMETILLIGGTTPEEDKQTIARYTANPSKAMIIVGTPGKLESSLYASPALFRTRQLEVLIMDEADSLLEMGFDVSLNRILQKLPKQRRTGLFSATQTKELVQLIRAGLRNPVQVNVTVNSDTGSQSNGDQVTPTSLKNHYCIIPVEEKLRQLVEFLLAHPKEKVICYFLTCAQVNYFWRTITRLSSIEQSPLRIFSLHGKVPHDNRKGIYESFVRQECGALFTTDVAARGLDFPDVDWVLQYDPPQQPDQFVHRIGRTARMGRSGNALVYLTPDEDDYVEFLRYKGIPIEKMESLPLSNNIIPDIQEQQKKERETYDKAQLSFVSFVRAYKEHACNYIFRMNRLDLGHLANGFGLLNLPKMPELTNPNRSIHFHVTAVDTNSIRYKDKKREAARQKKLKQLRAKQEERANRLKPVKIIKKTDAWSAKRRRTALDKGFDVRPSIDAGSDDEEDWNDDWKEFAAEKKLQKRLRKGKISQRHYQKEMQNLDALSEMKKLTAGIPSLEESGEKKS